MRRDPIDAKDAAGRTVRDTRGPAADEYPAPCGWIGRWRGTRSRKKKFETENGRCAAFQAAATEMD